MFVAAYDDRFILPGYFFSFIRNTTSFCDLHLISPNHKLWGNLKSASQISSFNVQTIGTPVLPEYRYVKQLFDSCYVNYSTNLDSFERACFYRWFALNSSTVNLNDNDYICLLDTDFMIGMSPSDVLSMCLDMAGGKDVQFVAQWDGDVPRYIGPQITIMTKAYLFGFCRYLLTTFFSPSAIDLLRGDYFDRIGKGLPGGVSDMRALADYSRLYPDNLFNLNNLKEPYSIANFTWFLNSEVGKAGNWKILFQAGTQILQVGDESKKLLGIHFQGGGKTFMPLVVEQNREFTRVFCLEYLAEEDKILRKIINRLKGTVRHFANRFVKAIYYAVTCFINFVLK